MAEYLPLLYAIARLLDAPFHDGPAIDESAFRAGQLEICHSTQGWRIRGRRSGELRIDVTDRGAGGATYHFQISPHLPGQRCFAQVGALALSYNHASHDPTSEFFAKVMIAAMRRLESRPLSEGDLPEWRELISGFLDRARVSSRFRWELAWHRR